MKITSATYEHRTIGFPQIALKWHFDGTRHYSPYVTEFGVMKPWSWEFCSSGILNGPIERECERFDRWVRTVYADNAQAQSA